MVSDRDLVVAAAATYAGNVPTWSFFQGAVCVFRSQTADGLPVFSAEGTHNNPGWALDFCAVPIHDAVVNHADLGRIHSGFWFASRPLIPVLLDAIGDQPFALAGHSLGAALALLLGAELIIRGKRPERIGAFAPPRVGMAEFVSVVTKAPLSAYRFGNDPVTEVPDALPGFPYAQVPLIAVGARLPDRFDCHAIKNYLATVGV